MSSLAASSTRTASEPRERETIFHRIIKDYGTDVGHDFLNSITRLINGFLTIRGFSYSIDELNIADKERNTINSVMRKMEKSVENLIEQAETGTLERLPGQTMSGDLRDQGHE